MFPGEITAQFCASGGCRLVVGRKPAALHASTRELHQSTSNRLDNIKTSPNASLPAWEDRETCIGVGVEHAPKVGLSTAHQSFWILC